MSGSVLPFGVVPNSISWFQCLAILKPDVFYTSNKIKPALHFSPRVDPPKDRWDRHDTGPGVDFPKGKTLLLCVCVYSSSMILVPLHTFALNSYVDMFQGLASSEWTRNRRSGTPSRRFPLSQCQTRPLVCTWVLPCGGKTWADSRKVMGHQVFKSIAWKWVEFFCLVYSKRTK